ncbi:MAG: TIGR00730 family Rossman fold protein [Anaerolineae bacterium]|jgi:hypothetical protein|nr:TIGR00730 family Rossman fold protein [Anaerolineae bacterium]
MKNICVFCGSTSGHHLEYRRVTEQFGQLLVQGGFDLVYGGGNTGLMGAIANTVLEAGGKVHGVMPRAMVIREIAHPNLTEQYIVESMHERKALMSHLADAFVILPGGYGTMDEFFEIVTWGILGIHRKPIVILNINGYYDPLIRMIQHMAENGFLRQGDENVVQFTDQVDQVIDLLQKYQPTLSPKWIKPEET